MKPLVIYHAGCADGFCAAWLFRLAFPDAEFHAAHYGTEPPGVAGKRVYIADFSYRRDVMCQIIEQADSVCVLDHHKTAQEELRDLPSCTAAMFENLGGRIYVNFDMTKSGGRLAWEHLYGQQLLPGEILATNRSGYSCGVAPWFVKYTEDRDLWLWKLPDSREISAALRSYPMEFSDWDYLHEHGQRMTGWQELITEGRAILRDQKQTIESHVSHAREIELDGHKILSVNATTLISEIAGELAKDRPFGLCYFQRKDGLFVYSLRSREGGLDVSEIAKRHGGGGHPRAAGYESVTPPEF